MKNIFKYTRANVCIKDKETSRTLFEDSNLFVDSGRNLIANVLRGAVTIIPAFFVCDLGSDDTVSSTSQLDLVSYTSPLSIAPVAGYPIALTGEPTGVHFQFSFNNISFGGDQVIRELGLFYRVDSDDSPRRGSDPTTMTGTMLARLKTTLNSIVVGDTRTITIDWKIIF